MRAATSWLLYVPAAESNKAIIVLRLAAAVPHVAGSIGFGGEMSPRVFWAFLGRLEWSLGTRNRDRSEYVQRLSGRLKCF